MRIARQGCYRIGGFGIGFRAADECTAGDQKHIEKQVASVVMAGILNACDLFEEAGIVRFVHGVTALRFL